MIPTSLKDIPSIDNVLKELDGRIDIHEDYLKLIIIKEVDILRYKIKQKELYLTKKELLYSIIKSIKKKSKYSLSNLINGTGIVLHTGLGRAPFNSYMLRNVADRLEGYSNLEFDLFNGQRGDRQDHIKDHLSAICGSESGIVVNNNAGAVMLVINEIARGGEVICSRGQLVEIGGSFRIPDIINKSGGILKEVGTTNRTHLEDYEHAINPNTKLILQVHTSNYVVKGYTKSVELSKLIKLGKKYKIPVISDWGSGSFLNMRKYILSKELPIKKIIKEGPDLITFSGDKLIGGPQSGLIVGKRKWIKAIKSNTLYRTLRCNKVTIALLEEVLRTYKSKTFKKDNLSLTLLTSTQKEIKERARYILDLINHKQIQKYNIKLIKSEVEAGSGSLPEKKIKSMAFKFEPINITAEKLACKFRLASFPVVGYISKNIFYIDLKAVIPTQISQLVKTINKL